MRNHAMLAMLIGCGLRRAEVVTSPSGLEPREDHWVLADLIGKGGHMRTVPVPGWVKSAVMPRRALPTCRAEFFFVQSERPARCGVRASQPSHLIHRPESSGGLWLRDSGASSLRRTCTRLWCQAGGELEHIQFLLDHVSVQTTERYLACKQRLRNAVNSASGWNQTVPDRRYSTLCDLRVPTIEFKGLENILSLLVSRAGRLCSPCPLRVLTEPGCTDLQVSQSGRHP